MRRNTTDPPATPWAWANRRAASLGLDTATYLTHLVQQEQHAAGKADPRRRAVLDLVRARPGIHFRAIVASAGTPRRDVERRMRLLEEGGLVTMVTLPRYKRYFPSGSMPPLALRVLAELEGGSARAALETIRRHPGLSLTDLARRLGVSPAATHKIVTRLSKAGLVGKHREGRRVRLLAIDRGGGLSPDGRLRKPRQPPPRRAPPSALGRAAPAGAALRDRRLKAWAERRGRELGFDDVNSYLLHLVEQDRRRARAGDAQRQAILELIRSRPGIHRRGIRAAAGLPAREVGRHLFRLEAWGAVTSLPIGLSRHYFLAGSVAADAMPALARLEVGAARAAYEAVRREPGINVADLARRLGVTQPAASAAVQRLRTLGLVQKQAVGPGRRVRIVARGLAEARRSRRRRPMRLTSAVSPARAPTAPPPSGRSSAPPRASFFLSTACALGFLWRS